MSSDKKPWVFVLAAIGLLFLLLVCFCVGSAVYCGKSVVDASGEVSVSARAFFQSIKDGNVREAYDATDDAFREHTGFDDFQSFSAQPELRQWEELDPGVRSLNVNNGEGLATLSVAIRRTTTDPFERTFMVQLSKAPGEDSSWRIRALDRMGHAASTTSTIGGRLDAGQGAPTPNFPLAPWPKERPPESE